MRVVVALGGHALLRRGEPPTIEVQRRNVRIAASAVADLARDYQLALAHGNGPQVGLLAMQAAAFKATEPYPLDVLNAQTEGMIGYLLEQELMNALPSGVQCATLLTMVEVDPSDPAFNNPTKPIGPAYDAAEASRIAAETGWIFAEELPGEWRRVVPSPIPRRILEIEVIRFLVDAEIVVICAGGGGIPTTRSKDGKLEGVEAVIDKDRAAYLLAVEIGAKALLLLTDVEAVFENWGTPHQRPIRRAVEPEELAAMQFDPGEMGPKLEAACAFVRATNGIAGIGRVEDARAILEGRAGTLVVASKDAAPAVA